MPHHPSDEETDSNVFDKVAQESKDSGASDHPMHIQPHPGDKSKDKPSVAEAVHAHSGKGPVIADSTFRQRVPQVA